MEQSVFDPLSKITQALRDGEVREKQAHTYLAKCIDNLLHLEARTEGEMQNALRKYLLVFDHNRAGHSL